MAGTNINIQPNVNNSSVVLAAQQKLSEMSYEIKPFNHPKFGEVRVAVFENGEILFCLSDLARGLGYARPADAVSAHCKGVVILPTPSAKGNQPTKFGKEGNIYRLTLKSQLPDAEEFQDWVCDDLLPTLRKTGSYSLVQQPIQQPLVHPLKPLTLKDMTSWAKEMKNTFRLNDASTLELYQDISNIYGGILPTPKHIDSEGAILSASDLFKRMGYKNGKGLTAKLNIILKEKGILEQIERSTSHGETTKFWSITEEGLKYGENKINKENKKETNPYWYIAKFDEMLSVVGFNPVDYIKK